MINDTGTRDSAPGSIISEDQLREKARSASSNAYSPYSRVRVGAVAVTTDGRTFSGCNVENASYGLTQCAERNAIGAAMAAGVERGQLHTMLVYSNGFDALSPCGACRQVMSELMSADATVISCSEDKEPRYWKISDLMPDPFSLGS